MTDDSTLLPSTRCCSGGCLPALRWLGLRLRACQPTPHHQHPTSSSCRCSNITTSIPQPAVSQDPPFPKENTQRRQAPSINTTTGCCHPAASPPYPTPLHLSGARPPSAPSQQRTAPAHLSALARINNSDCHPPVHPRPPALDFEAARTHRTRPHTCASLHCCPPFIYPCTSSAQRSLFAPSFLPPLSHRTAPHTHPHSANACTPPPPRMHLVAHGESAMPHHVCPLPCLHRHPLFSLEFIWYAFCSPLFCGQQLALPGPSLSRRPLSRGGRLSVLLPPSFP